MTHAKKSILLGGAILLASVLPRGAGAQELSAPIVAFTPVIAKNAEALGLTGAQRADLAAWKETMPAKRKAVEAEALIARATLREAIIAGAPREDRQALADEVGALEARLVMLRSDCTDHWRAVLTEDQFARMLAMAGG